MDNKPFLSKTLLLNFKMNNLFNYNKTCMCLGKVVLNEHECYAYLLNRFTSCKWIPLTRAQRRCHWFL